VRKLLGILLLVLFTGQVLGIAEFIGGDDCAQECVENGSGVNPPACNFCHCCLASNVFLPPQALAAESSAQVPAAAIASEHAPASAPARDISHVPRISLA